MTPITRRSIITGKTHTRDVPVDAAKAEAWRMKQLPGLIQDVFPDLSAEDREFIFTGITPKEWRKYMAPVLKNRGQT